MRAQETIKPPSDAEQDGLDLFVGGRTHGYEAQSAGRVASEHSLPRHAPCEREGSPTRTRSLHVPSSIPALTHPSAPPPTWRIVLNLLDQNPHQPRSQMDEGALAELMAGIRDHGLLQPINIRKVGARYQAIAGHRRLEAFRRLLANTEHQDEATAELFRTRGRADRGRTGMPQCEPRDCRGAVPAQRGDRTQGAATARAAGR